MKSIASLAATVALFYGSTVDAQQGFLAPRTAVNATSGALEPVQQIPPCTYFTPNGTTGTPIILNLTSTVNYSSVVNSSTPAGWEVCYVWDPLRAQAPWSNSSFAYPQSFNPDTFVCTATNFLCQLPAQYACGRSCFNSTQYSCVVDQAGLFGSYLIPTVTNCSNVTLNLTSPPTSSTASLGVYTALVPPTSPLSTVNTSVTTVTTTVTTNTTNTTTVTTTTTNTTSASPTPAHL